MQNDFVTGSLGSSEAQNIVQNVKEHIARRYRDNFEIIFTRDTHNIDYLNTLEGQYLPVEHCIKGTNGWQIVKGLETPHCHYIDKNTFGWLNWNYRNLNNGSIVPYTSKYDYIEVIGVCTDICVISNALILRSMFPNTRICVISDCCAGTSPEQHTSALNVMRSCQIDVINTGVLMEQQGKYNTKISTK